MVRGLASADLKPPTSWPGSPGLSCPTATHTGRLKAYAFPPGFALQVIGFCIVAVCARYQLRGIEEGLACAGVGYGSLRLSRRTDRPSGIGSRFQHSMAINVALLVS
jgi:hypothetical protein